MSISSLYFSKKYIRSIDVILRHENVEKAKAGDRIVFTGALIVIPDISQFSKMGEPAVLVRNQNGKILIQNFTWLCLLFVLYSEGVRSSEGPNGVRGLKVLGQRELTYKLAFLACSVQVGNI